MKWRATLAGLAVVAAAACDPRVYLDVRQPLRPAPTLACLRSALASSPYVAELGGEFRESGDEGFALALRDSAAEGGRRWVTLARRAAAPAPGETVELSLVWVGLKRPPAAEERAAMAVAGRLLAQLRAACAPASPPGVTCKYTSGQPVRFCPPAA